MNSAKFLNFLSLLCFLAAVVYAICMFIYPWLGTNGNWIYVQVVWDRWQALNVGILAFFASVIAFNISRFNADQQRSREFLAAKAFLPAAFDELSEYFKYSASILERVWNSQPIESNEIDPTQLHSDYRVIFEKCIRHASPGVGRYLVGVLVQLQVHNARVKQLARRAEGTLGTHSDRSNIITYLYCLGILQALINRNFDFARNAAPFDPEPLKWEDLRNAYRNLNVRYENYRVEGYPNLEDFTKRAVGRGTRTREYP